MSWDISQRRAEQRDRVQNAANVFYSQLQTNYNRLRRTNPVLRAEIALIMQGNLDRVLDVSPLVPLQETSDEVLVALAPSIKSDVNRMNRVLTAVRETGVINSQIRWRDAWRARRMLDRTDLTVLFHADSVLLDGQRFLMGVIEAPDTLWKRMNIPSMK
jgi:hypothetical protein